MQKQKQPLDFFSDGAAKQQWVEGGRKINKKVSVWNGEMGLSKNWGKRRRPIRKKGFRWRRIVNERGIRKEIM